MLVKLCNLAYNVLVNSKREENSLEKIYSKKLDENIKNNRIYYFSNNWIS